MSDIREICNLSDEELAERRRTLREELVPHIRGRAPRADGVALTFEAGPERRRALESFVEFERGCCPGLGFALHEEGGTLRLEIDGLDPETSLLQEAAPREAPVEGTSSRTARVARAGGLGAVGAFALFCGIPISVGAVAGASVAAPLGVLDHPLVIGGGSLVLAAGIWRWERRRSRRMVEAPCSGSAC